MTTEGRIDTTPKPGATLLEPWDHDSANSYERLESTLQSIHRYAVVKVHAVENGCGFWVEVAVYKELEDVRRPEHATAGSATFRNDITPNRSDNPGQPVTISSGQSPGLTQNGFPRAATRRPNSGSWARSATVSRPREHRSG